MQETHMISLLGKKFTSDDDYQELSEKIKEDFAAKEQRFRTPTAEELQQMKKFEYEFRGKHPKASDREVRRAIQRKFNLQILK